MLEYRLSADDDDIDDYDEEANINVEDNLGDYGMDDDDEVEEVIIVTEVIPVCCRTSLRARRGDARPGSLRPRRSRAKKAARQKAGRASRKSCRQEGRPKKAAAQEGGCQSCS